MTPILRNGHSLRIIIIQRRSVRDVWGPKVVQTKVGSGCAAVRPRDFLQPVSSLTLPRPLPRPLPLPRYSKMYRLAWPLRKDDTLYSRYGSTTFFFIFFVEEREEEEGEGTSECRPRESTGGSSSSSSPLRCLDGGGRGAADAVRG